MAEKGITSVHAEYAEHNARVHGNNKWWNLKALANLIIVGLSLGLFGYDNAFASPLVSLPLFVEKYQGVGFDGALAFKARNLDLIISVPLIGAAFGAFAAIPLQRYLGRKRSFLVAYSTMCLPGSILQLFSPNLTALVVGRFWNYIGISVLTNIAPIYLSELVPANHRARAVGLTVAGSSAVSVIATAIVWASAKFLDKRQYIIPLAIQAAAPLLLLCLSFFLTESPTWLISCGKMDEAKRNLMSIRAGNTDLVVAELAIAKIALNSSDEQRASVKPWEILGRENLERTMSSAAPVCLSQVGGQILVGTYSTVILTQSGVADPFKITIIIFLLQFAGTVVGPILLDKIGRRYVALPGFFVLLLLDLAAGIIACVGFNTPSQELGFAALCMIFAFVNSVAFQSVIFVLPTEIPTARLREPTIAWSTFWSYTTAIITTFAVPQITSPDAGNLGAKAFLVFAACMLITIIWAYFYLPETSNRSLAEVDEMYAAKIPKSKWRKFQTTGTVAATGNEVKVT